MILETNQTVPLEVWEDGSIRVKGTRLLVDMIINAYKRGEIAEEIADSFSAATAAEVHLIIAYYLTHKADMEMYLDGRKDDAERIWQKIESDPKHQARIDELKKFRKEKVIS
jgi:uncharacterized protein (DUF433 family)